jgi:glycerate kinase
MKRLDRPVLVAPDKFKGTLGAAEVGAAITRGLERAGIASDVCRIADGGEGTIDAVADASAVALTEAEVSDAFGEPVCARIALIGDGVALIESADVIGASGDGRSPSAAVEASSRGVGELIEAAAGAGAARIFVAIGGTVTTDGGAGAIEHLRERRLIGVRGPLKRCPPITALCDVRSAFELAPSVFGPQKGATPEQVELLEQRLHKLAADLPRDPRGIVMTGAGGGLSGGLWAACGAELKSGAAWVLDRANFTRRMLASRAVITGEGALDSQTLLGKAAGEVATRARQSGVPCHAIVGRMAMTRFDARILDFESVLEAGSPAKITDATKALARLLPTS